MANERKTPLTEMVHVGDAQQVEYWCKRLSVTESELKAAVAKAGRTLAAVADALKHDRR